MRESIGVGEVVTYVDQFGKSHDALITAVHGYNTKEERDENYRQTYEFQKGNSWCTEEWLQGATNSPFNAPSINLVYVELDNSKHDPYGNQITRETSVVHQTSQPAHGRYWTNKKSMSLKEWEEK